MSAPRNNLWAPWRMEYIRSLEDERAEGCFLCRYWSAPDSDRRNLVLWRSEGAMVLLNRFPYNSGHILVAPAAHVAGLDDLDGSGMLELLTMTRDVQHLLSDVMHPQGFNVGMNFGRCAGAGLPDHMHVHVVPRWEGDTNFMPVLGDVRVIPEAIDNLYVLLAERSRQLKLARKRSPSDR